MAHFIIKRLLDFYKPVFHKCEPPETGYWVEIPEFPGCVSNGETLEEAREMIEEAAEGWVLTTLEQSTDWKTTSDMSATQSDDAPPLKEGVQRAIMRLTGLTDADL